MKYFGRIIGVCSNYTYINHVQFIFFSFEGEWTNLNIKSKDNIFSLSHLGCLISLGFNFFIIYFWGAFVYKGKIKATPHIKHYLAYKDPPNWLWSRKCIIK
jgi:hypothetical protein